MGGEDEGRQLSQKEEAKRRCGSSSKWRKKIWPQSKKQRESTQTRLARLGWKGNISDAFMWLCQSKAGMLWVGHTGGSHFIQWMCCFCSIVQVVIEIRKKLTPAECATPGAAPPTRWILRTLWSKYSRSTQEVELDEGSAGLTQGHPASRQQCQNPSSYSIHPKHTLPNQCHLHSSLCPDPQSRSDAYYLSPLRPKPGRVLY